MAVSAATVVMIVVFFIRLEPVSDHRIFLLGRMSARAVSPGVVPSLRAFVEVCWPRSGSFASPPQGFDDEGPARRRNRQIGLHAGRARCA